MLIKFLLIIILSNQILAVNIQDFGAIPFSKDLQTQINNAKAIRNAFLHASTAIIKQVIVPNKTYHTMPIFISGLNEMILFNQGTLVASKRIEHWPLDGKKFLNFIEFTNCSNILIKYGTFDGKGYRWWVHTLVDHKKLLSGKTRPHLLQLNECINCSIHYSTFINSPFYHINILDSKKIIIGDISIKVNRTKQHNLIKQFKIIDKLGAEMFPFNTDGIDPQAQDVHIYNLLCQNYNDIVVIKPGNRGLKNIQCAQNILVQNVTSYLGSGLSLGTVKPSQKIDCIRNITFRNSVLHHPYKGLYIKHFSNSIGSALIQNILYQNITIINPIYWPIYIGPHRDGPGCINMSKCQSDPKVTMQNYLFQDINIINPNLYPYMILCNSTNPCKNITFQNVNSNKWLVKINQKCYNAEITATQSSPQPICQKH